MRSEAKVMPYKLQLETLKKGNLSMKDYLGQMKHYMDVLVASGHPRSDDDEVLYILTGVGLENYSVVVYGNPKYNPCLFLKRVYFCCLTKVESNRIKSYTGDVAPPSVNITMCPKKLDYQHQNSGGRGRGRYARDGRRSWNNSSGLPVYQICGTPGYVAHKCHHRFDKEFFPYQQQSVRYYSPQQGVNKSFNQHPNLYPAASLSTAHLETTIGDWWFLDSGATYHVTNDLGRLSMGSECSWDGKVHVGNGASLSISYRTISH